MGDAARRKAAGTYPDQKPKPVRVVTVRTPSGLQHFERDSFGHWCALRPGSRIYDRAIIGVLNAVLHQQHPPEAPEPQEEAAGA